MRIGKTRIFQSMKYVLPALALLTVGALAIIKNSSAATCTGYYICYAATEGGIAANPWDNNPRSGEPDGQDYYGGNGARALPNEGYVFVEWRDETGAKVSESTTFLPCGALEYSCSGKVRVHSGGIYTAVFEREGSEPTPTAATDSFTLGAIVDSGALDGKTIALTLSALEDDAPMPSSTQASISSDTTSVSFGEITFAEEGTWRYRISLQTPSGVTADASNLEVRVRATLDQANNTIVTEKTFYKNQEELTSEDDFLVRVHAIPPTAAEENISLATSVENGALEGNEAITLTLDGTPAPATTSQAVNKDTTSVSFGEISFTEPGSYRYSININNPYATAQPDATNLEVKIDATLNTDNNAIETSKTYYKNNSEVSESDFILNILLVEPTPAVGHAAFSNVIDSAADTSNFTATMTPVGGAPIPSNPQGEIIDGTNLSFGAVEFTEPGYYEFVVELKNGDKTHKIKLTADLVLDRSSNTLQFEGGDVLDEDGTAINNDKLREIIAELLAGDQTPDDDQDDSEDESETPSSDDTDVPNTVDTINAAAYSAIGATIFLLGFAVIKKKR